MDGEQETLAQARAGIAGVTAFVVFVLWVTSFWTARRRHDRSRVGVWWLKLALPLYVIALILAIVRDAAQINLLPYMPRLNFNSGGFFDEASKNTVHLAFTTESRARYISDMLLRIADATAVVAFVEIGNGFIFALYRQRTSSQKTLRWIAIPVVGVLVLLAIVLAGVYNVDVYRHDKRLIDIGMGSETLSSSSYFDFDEIVAKIRIFQYMEGVCSVLNFILAQGVLVQACVVMHRYTRIAQAKGCAATYLSASIFYFLRHMWFFIVASVWVFPVDAPFMPLGVSYTCDIILNIIFLGITTILLFVVGSRKKTGLWTTLQPWMNGVEPVMVVSQKQYYGAPHPHQQQQMPGYYHQGSVYGNLHNGHPPMGHQQMQQPYLGQQGQGPYASPYGGQHTTTSPSTELGSTPRHEAPIPTPELMSRTPAVQQSKLASA